MLYYNTAMIRMRPSKRASLYDCMIMNNDDIAVLIKIGFTITDTANRFSL
jgi:hypothetical protein